MAEMKSEEYCLKRVQLDDKYLGEETLGDANKDAIKTRNFYESLTSIDDSSSVNDGSKVHVGYQLSCGVSGAYREDTTLKACPKSEIVPCDDYKVAFKLNCGRLLHAFVVNVAPNGIRSLPVYGFY
ncbi:hypothetical protein KIW84_030273 [Lathyrus oleraceus]|uniref:Uncharacterized protein n=1 Tax=Pisum sativum TaxID=3888 RepID=A0A9D4XP78_PEA|nr:hypothetical protein KIW84_030273 [Pisum sativum]